MAIQVDCCAVPRCSACTSWPDPADELLAHYRQETVLRQASLYQGVCQKGERWQAQLKHGGRNIYAGHHDTEEEAARAYDEKVLELKGRCAAWRPEHSLLQQIVASLLGLCIPEGPNSACEHQPMVDPVFKMPDVISLPILQGTVHHALTEPAALDTC